MHDMVRQDVGISANPSCLSPHPGAKLGIQVGDTIYTHVLQQGDTVVGTRSMRCNLHHAAKPRPYWLSAIPGRRSSFLRSGMWCASNPRHAWLSDRFARGLVRASCLCDFQGVVRFGPTRDLRCKRGRRRRDGRRWNSAITILDDGHHERRTSRHCQRLAASCDRRNSRHAPHKRIPHGTNSIFMCARIFQISIAT